MTRSFWKCFVAVALLATTFAVRGQGFPARTITIVCPFAAGGPTDTIARILAERLSKTLNQTVIVEDVAGAGGTIGVNKVMRSAPDGYTVGIGHIGTHVIAPAVQQLNVNYVNELEPVIMIATNPQVLVTRPGLPAKDLASLVTWVKANPEKVNAGTGGPGTPSHVSAVYFGNMINTPVTIIHYKGSGPALQDVMAGHIDFTFEQALTALPQIRSGRVHAYAVTAKSRLASAPEIPTTDEAGLPGLYMSIWHAFWAPKGTPPEVIAKLNAALRDALTDPTVRGKLADLGQEIPTSEQQSPEALRAFHQAEVDKWWPVIKAAGIKVQ